MNRFSFGQRFGWVNQRGARAVLAPSTFVDSLVGNDANPGTQAAPLRSLAAAQAAALAKGAGSQINLKRGSRWHESLDLSGIANATVQTYGTGATPIIDGADPVSAWTLTSGRTSVYQATVSHDGTGTNRLTVYEDGVLLARVADQATCDSTPGSFVDAKGSDGSPLTIYVHPANVGNPASNGHLYEVSVRLIVLRLGAGASVNGVQTMRQVANDGSLLALNQTGQKVSRVLALDGTKHNLSLGAGVATDCIAARADAPTAYEGSNTAYVGYLNDATGQSVTFRRCGAILQPAGLVNDFYSHGSAHNFASTHYEQVWSVGPVTGSGATSVEGSYWRGSQVFPLDVGTVTRSLFYTDATNGRPTPLANNGALSVSDSICFIEERYAVGNYNEVLRPQGSSTFSHCAFSGPTSNTNLTGSQGGAATLTLDRCVVDGGVFFALYYGPGTYQGDYNVFRATNSFNAAAQVQFYFYAAGGYSGYVESLAEWQARTGQDQHSVYLRAADQGKGNATAFWLGQSSDLNHGPADGDWRVNPQAKVYGADGTAYTGTYPDGTPITQAGPQSRWNWQGRASVPGAPREWPQVPQSVAQAQTYVADPGGWKFSVMD